MSKPTQSSLLLKEKISTENKILMAITLVASLTLIGAFLAAVVLSLKSLTRPRAPAPIPKQVKVDHVLSKQLLETFDYRPSYLPGEILIKFKDKALIEDLLKNKKSSSGYLKVFDSDLTKIFQTKKIEKSERLIGSAIFNPDPQALKIGLDRIVKISSSNLRQKGERFKNQIKRILEEKRESVLSSGEPERQYLSLGESITINTDQGPLVITDSHQLDPATQDLLDQLRKSPQVEYAGPNYLYQTSLTPQDPRYSEQWAHQNIQSELAWETETGDSSVAIAVVDTGVDLYHPDLDDRIWVNKAETVGDANQDGCPGICGISEDSDGEDGSPTTWIDTNANGIIDTEDIFENYSPLDGYDGVQRAYADGVDNDGDGRVDEGIDEDSNGRVPGENWYINDLKDDDDENGFIDDTKGWDFVSVTSCGGGGEDCYEICHLDEDCDGVRDNKPTDVHGHGTHISGIIAAEMNNNEGVVGICPECRVMAIRAGYKGADGYGWLAEADIGEAIKYAVDNKVKVISMSWGSYSESEIIRDVLDYASSKGLLLVGAAGNANTDLINYPAGYETVIAVAATDLKDKRTFFSNYGAWVDVTAPGIDILSTLPEGQYDWWSGTSMATPYVAGLAGLLFSQNPDWDRERITEQILFSTDNINLENYGYVNLLGTGRINASKIFKTESGPYIEYYGSQIKGRLEHGETIDLVVKLRNRWLDAENVNAVIHVDDPYLSLIDNQSFYGNISSGEVKDNSQDPFKFSLDENTPSCHSFTAILEISASDYKKQDYFLLVEINDLPAWPISLEERGTYSSPVIGDLDGDGVSEIVLGSGLYDSDYSDARVRAWKPDGTELWSADLYWRQPEKITLSDLDGDFLPEVLFGTYTPGEIYILKGKDGTPFNEHWPRSVTGNVESIISVGNLDGDPEGTKELVVTTYDYFYAFDLNGELLPGNWPIRLYSRGASTPALGDLDGDGTLEIIIGTGIQGEGYKIYDYQGNLIRELYAPKRAHSTPALGDLDNDGKLEIVVGTFNNQTGPFLWDGKLYAYESDGTLLPGEWPVSTPGYIGSSPSLADLDEDGYLDIIVGSGDGNLYVFNHKGAPLPGWPYQTNGSISSSPAVGNIDSDEQLEIVIGATDSKVYAFNHDGSLVKGWPILTPSYPASAVLGDLDNNGSVEIIAVNSYNPEVHTWSCGSNQKGKLFWPMFHYDPEHTGLYQPPNQAPILDPIGDKEISAGQTLEFTVTASDPDGDTLTFRAEDLPEGAEFPLATITPLIPSWPQVPGRVLDLTLPSSRQKILKTNQATFKWTPTESQVGNHQITFYVNDEKAQDSEKITIYVY